MAVAPVVARGRLELVGVALLDLSTGEFTAAEYAGADGLQALADELAVLKPREILVPATRRRCDSGSRDRRSIAASRPRRSTPIDAVDVRGSSRRGARCSISCAPAASKASASTVTRPRSPPPARSSTTSVARRRSISRTCASIAYRQRADALLIDPTTLKHLEILEGSEGGREGSLLDELDRTVTSIGSRLLRSWLLRPLVALEPIRDRLDAVEELAFRTTERGKFRDAIKAVQDLERLVARAALGTAGPRDLVGLKQSLAVVPRVRTVLAELQAPLVRSLVAELDDLADVRDAIEPTLVDDPPALARDGGFTRDGVDPELDELRAISRSGKQVIAEMEERERARTGIALAEGPLQPRVRVLHRDLEVEPARGAGRLPPQADDRRRRTVHHAGAEGVRGEGARRRRADPRARARDLRAAARRAVAAEAPRIQATARALAALDVLAALAEDAAVNNYIKPHVHDGDELTVVDARHPVVERRTASAGDAFVPNDITLNGPSVPAGHPDRPEHGRQVDLPAADGAALRDGAGRIVRAGARGEDAARRSHLRARRRVGQHRARPLDVHGRDAGDGQHPAHGDVAQPGRARRDRPRHGDLRRPEHRLGGRRVPGDEPDRCGRRRCSPRTTTS